jgi:hypothetical protein
MNEKHSASRQVYATVLLVLPRTGLAYVVDEAEGSWAVTKSMRGVGIETLEPGQRLALTIVRYRDFAVVSEYARLN